MNNKNKLHRVMSLALLLTLTGCLPHGTNSVSSTGSNTGTTNSTPSSATGNSTTTVSTTTGPTATGTFPPPVASPPPVSSATPAAKFIRTFAVYYGGGPRLTAADAPKLARFDLIDIDRFRYDQIDGNTWQAIKSINPGSQIYLYEMGPETTNYSDSTGILWLNNISRYKMARNAQQGSLYYNHPYLFLLDRNNQPTYNIAFSQVPDHVSYLMDFGHPDYQAFWSQSVRNDIVDQPWKADGVFVDNCDAVSPDGAYGTRDASGTVLPPVKYPDPQSWANAMNSFAEAISANLHAAGQKVWCNRGGSRDPVGQAAWTQLDGAASHPDFVMEEGAFAVGWGSDTQFYNETEWRRQVNQLAHSPHIGLAFLSHTKLVPTGTGSMGTDNYGQPVTFHQTLWYALGSFLLGENDSLHNACFAFVSMNPAYAYNAIQWFDEYDKIDLGKAMGGYRYANMGGNDLYWRAFEKGYVVVNPTANAIDGITRFGKVRILTHDNLSTPPAEIPVVSTIALPAHHAVILLRP